jgi:hypothetical protein
MHNNEHSSDADLLLVLPTDLHPVAAAKTLLQALVRTHRMYLTDAAEKSTIALVAEHFANYGARNRKSRAFLDN